MKADQARRPRQEKEVWAQNLKEEVRNMSDAAETFSYVAVEAQVPAVVASPTGPFGSYLEYNYSMMKCNVDLNHALNISFSLSDSKGQRPRGVSTWRFNFLYDPHKDFFSQEYLEQMYSKDRLESHQLEGIKCDEFGELLLGTGMVLSEETNYIAFSCESGLSESSRQRNGAFCDPPERRFNGLYCFSYLLRILMSRELPNDVHSFYEALDLFFPRRCDLYENAQQLTELFRIEPSDPQRRPLFCFAPSCLEAFHALPEAARRPPRRPKLETPPDAGKPSRRRQAEKEKATNGTVVNGHGGHGTHEAKARVEPSWQ